MDRSVFARASNKASSFLSPSRSELPRWRSPSPMSESIIPPPIVQSTYASPPSQVARSVLIERPSPLQDRQGELKADLQYLLDAQVQGLVKGFESGVQDDITSNGSTTPTARSVRSSSGRQAARPIKRQPGLRSARKGLYNTMLALSAVKDDELDSISTTLREKDERIGQLDSWARKKSGLQEAARNVDSNEETVRVQRLSEQAMTVETEIRELERQLEDRQILHRKLMRQVADVENTMQARMASYTSSLQMLEEDVQKFLALTPADEATGAVGTTNGDVRQSVWQLPPKRRTLELAKEQYTHDRDVIIEQRSNISREKDALEEGAAVWKDVVTSVTDFERKMREDMRGAQAEQSQEDAEARLKELLRHLHDLLGTLDSKLELAKERNWNLLIAAISAEVDALQKGKRILEGVLGIDADQEQNGNGDLVDTQEPSADDSGGEEIHGLDKSFETARPLRRRQSNEGHSSEDEPDPELLFSEHEVDS